MEPGEDEGEEVVTLSPEDAIKERYSAATKDLNLERDLWEKELASISTADDITEAEKALAGAADLAGTIAAREKLTLAASKDRVLREICIANLEAIDAKLHMKDLAMGREIQAAAAPAADEE